MAELRALIEVPVMGMIAESCEGERIPAVKALRKVADAITDAAARKDLVAYIELDTSSICAFSNCTAMRTSSPSSATSAAARALWTGGPRWHRPHAATVRGAPADGRCRPGAGRRDDENPHGTTHWPRPVGLGRPRRRAVTLRLTPVEQAMLDGSEGEGVALAMRIVTGLARVRGAEELVDVTGAHIDSCLYHGRAGLDFAEKLVDLGARVRVPTTLNVGSLDLLHPGTVRADAEHPELLTAGRALMDAYVALGARTTFTCALSGRCAARRGRARGLGGVQRHRLRQLGARCPHRPLRRLPRHQRGNHRSCAEGRIPPRRGPPGRRRPDVTAVAPERWHDEAWYAVLGYLLGRQARSRVAAIVGLPATTSEDDLKALRGRGLVRWRRNLPCGGGSRRRLPDAGERSGALGSASSQALGRRPGSGSTRALHRRRGSDRRREPGHAHASLAEIRALTEEVERTRTTVATGVTAYLSTGEACLPWPRAAGLIAPLERAGFRIVVDTCTYLVPIPPAGTRVVMTNSGKWAHYAPGNLGIDVVIGTLAECVRYRGRSGGPG